MPNFVLIGHDISESTEKRKRHRPAHIEGIEGLEAAGRIHFAGPMLDAEGKPLGSVILFEARDLEEARGIAARDPYVCEGVFERHEVREVRQVFPRR
jgi:uncharacterized protein YciI